eukprot:jgi/Chlat1/7353/Chrsp59S06976
MAEQQLEAMHLEGAAAAATTVNKAEDGDEKKGGGSKKVDKKAERLAARAAAAAAKEKSSEEDDFAKDRYGDVPLVQSSEVTQRHWEDVAALDKSYENKTVLVRGRVHTVRGKGKSAFLVLRSQHATVQCVLFAGEVVSKGMVKYASNVTKESLVDIEGTISVPSQPIESTTQQVEIHVQKLFCISRAAPVLPFQLEDASRSEPAYQKAEAEGVQLVRVLQDVRLDNRVIDLRTPANQAIFRLQSAVCQLFRQSMLDQNFIEIHTPKLIAGASEGGAAVFKVNYMGRPGCLAQSPQLYKQMAICADFSRVFEIGPVFRAENSFTHRHLCEFVGLDLEMTIHEHYFEVLDVLDRLFVTMFDGLNERFAKELSVINEQYPCEPLQYLRPTLRLSFEEGVQMLKEAGVEVDPFGDLSTEVERTLGKLVKEKYNTDFYMLYRYPSAVRPFYTMMCPDDTRYSNSFDIFIRGEEIISGAQRVHDAELLARRATECGIEVETISAYIDAFKYGAPPHGGAGVGLERVVMLFCGLNNIRKTSMFPRDPKRLTP